MVTVVKECRRGALLFVLAILVLFVAYFFRQFSPFKFVRALLLRLMQLKRNKNVYQHCVMRESLIKSHILLIANLQDFIYDTLYKSLATFSLRYH